MHEELPQIAIAPFADPEQTGLATSGVLPGYQAQPGRKLAAILKMARITDRSNQGSGGQRPNPWNRPQALTDWVGFPNGVQLLVIIHQSFLQAAKLVIELLEAFLAHCGSFGPFGFEGGHEGVAEFRHTWREDDPIFPS
jgi:hypothetical protein